jgi:hypothetical protein
MCGVTFCSLNTQAGKELFLRPWLSLDFREAAWFSGASLLFALLLELAPVSYRLGLSTEKSASLFLLDRKEKQPIVICVVV